MKLNNIINEIESIFGEKMTIDFNGIHYLNGISFFANDDGDVNFITVCGSHFEGLKQVLKINGVIKIII